MKNKLDFNLRLVRKNLKNANIRIKPNLEVTFTAPLDMVQSDIDIILAKRMAWILKHLERFKHAQSVHLLENTSNEQFRYLGRSYRIELIESRMESIELLADCLVITLCDKSDIQRKQQMIQGWYYVKAQECFNRLISHYQPIVDKKINRMVIRKMTTRWGSCNYRKAYINLNLELIKYPLPAIEYVVFHELTHLIHHDHSKRFYDYIATYMPDWKIRKDLLKVNSSI